MLQRVSMAALVLALCLGASAQTGPDADMQKAIDAIRAGKVEELERLLKNRPELVREPDPKYEATLLHWAASRKDVKAVILLIDHKAPLTATNKEGATPLHVALVPSAVKTSGADLLVLVEKLSNSEVVNIATVDGKTALHLACQYNQLEVARFLIRERGANVNALTNTKKEPLHYALEAKNSAMVELLKAEKERPKPPPPAPTTTDGAAALRDAAAAGDLEEVKRLLQKNRQLINNQNELGETPLHLAAKHRRWAVVSELIGEGADVKLKNKQGHEFWRLLCPAPAK